MSLNYNIRNFNFRILIYILCLNTVGVLVIRSATNDPSMVGKQIFGIVASCFISIFVSLFDYHKLYKFNIIIYCGCLLMLIAVLLFGKNVNGATRWIVLPVIGQLQPSEFVKIGLILIFSWYLSKYQERINQPAIVGIAALLGIVPVFFILEQPNLSTSLVIIFVILCMVFAAGISYKWIAGTVGVLVPVVALFIYLLQYEMIPFLKGYQAQRILAKIYPSKYADINRQQNSSIMAIGSGQLWGKGLNTDVSTSVKNGNFLSEEQTDFIFAVIGEELGFVGSVVVIILFALIVYECLWLAMKAKDSAGRLLCIGIAALIAFQSFANIAVATGIFPNTGLPLPFVSYGTSSLFSMSIGVGLALNVGLQRKSSNH